MRAFDNLIFTAGQIAEIVGGTLFKESTKTICGFTTDSRTVTDRNLFLALRGENMDGHKFIDNAIERGCSCVISEEVILPREDISVIVVKNTLTALGALGAWYREQMPAKRIAITGSVGKTTTKQFVYAVLSQHFQTLKTEGNYNNEIGVPLTLLNLDKSDEMAVMELGMNHKGEMSRLSKLVAPDIAVITNIGSSHIENLGSRDGICDAKLEIIHGMKPGNILLINGDEPLLMAKLHEVRARGARPITFSKEDIVCDYFLSEISITARGGSFSLTDMATEETVHNIQITQTGEHNILNAAMAYIIGLLCGMQEDEIRKGLLSFENTGMRQNIYEWQNICIIEDCYNASPESMEASLKVLRAIADERGGRAVAVLGDMLELGSFTKSLHERVGKAVAENRVDQLLTFGKLGSFIAEGSAYYGLPANTIHENSDLTEPELTCSMLRDLLQDNDTVLFKASRAVKMERVLSSLTGKK